MGTRGQQEGYKQLLAWQRADDLALAVFRLAGLLVVQGITGREGEECTAA
jgi:hypothetical protein